MNRSANIKDTTRTEVWFVATDACTVEYDFDGLKIAIEQGALQLQNLVWRQGMSDWVELDQVPLLRMLVSAHVANAEVDVTTLPAPITAAPPRILDESFDDKTRVDDAKSVLLATSEAPEPIESPDLLNASYNEETPVNTSIPAPAAAPIAAVGAELAPPSNETFDDETRVSETIHERISTNPAPAPAGAAPTFSESFDDETRVNESKLEPLVTPPAPSPTESTSIFDGVLDESATFDNAQTERPPPPTNLAGGRSVPILGELSNTEIQKFEPLPVPITRMRLDSTSIFDGLFEEQAPTSDSQSAVQPIAATQAPVQSTAIFDGLFEEQAPTVDPQSAVQPIAATQAPVASSTTSNGQFYDGAIIVRHQPESTDVTRASSAKAQASPAIARRAIAPAVDKLQPRLPVSSIKDLAHKAAVSKGPTGKGTGDARLARPTFARPVAPKVELPRPVLKTEPEIPSAKANREKSAPKATATKPSTKPFTDKPLTKAVGDKPSHNNAVSDTTILPRSVSGIPTTQSLESLASKAPTKSKSATPPAPPSSLKPPPRSISSANPAAPAMSSVAIHTTSARVDPSRIVAVRSPEQTASTSVNDRSGVPGSLERPSNPNRMHPSVVPAFHQPDTLTTSAKPEPAVVDQASTGTEPLFDSIYPSISSIQPAAGNWHRSRRRLLVVAIALGAAAAIAVVVNSATPKQARSAATQLKTPSALSATRQESIAPTASHAGEIPAPDSPTAEVAQPSETTIVQNDQSMNQEPSSPESPTVAVEPERSQQKASRRVARGATQNVAESKRALVDSSRSTSNPRAERASRNRGETSASKSSRAGSQPQRNMADSVATWDQGTVEHRAWMNPGF